MTFRAVRKVALEGNRDTGSVDGGVGDPYGREGHSGVGSHWLYNIDFFFFFFFASFLALT